MSGRRPRGARPGRHIDPSKFEPNWDERILDFDQMDLDENLLRGIYAYGFKQPSDIQALAIKPICQKRNVLAQAQSGTGKTGAFSIGVLNRIDTSLVETQALLLAPTRELVDQIYIFIKQISEKMPNITIEVFKGGLSVTEDQRKAQEKPMVAICTPGRALDLISKGYLQIGRLQMFVLDEADEMLSEGFKETVDEICKYLDPEIQTCLFSATIPWSTISKIPNLFDNPVKILVKAEKLTLEGIKQFYVNVGETSNKLSVLLDIYGALNITKAVIFANSKATVDFLKSELEANKFTVSAIHSNLTQVERDTIMKNFRINVSRVLISTDLLARGIDVQQITLVINFELPTTREKYLHRIGRSGRYGRKGVAINICDEGEMRKLRDLEHFYSTQIAELPADINDVVNDANQSV